VFLEVIRPAWRSTHTALRRAGTPGAAEGYADR
jgi:hypothetical protein